MTSTGMMDDETMTTTTTTKGTLGHHGTVVTIKTDARIQHHRRLFLRFLAAAAAADVVAADVVSGFQIRSESLLQITVPVRCCSTDGGMKMKMMTGIPFLLKV